MYETIIQAYNEAVFDTDKESAFQVIEQALQQGVKAENIVFHVIIPAIEIMMEEINQYQDQDPDSNLAQHFMTAKIASEVTEKMLQKFRSPPTPIGCVVIGTAFGDLHSLGKRIITGCLKAMMVEVIDIGVNVPPQNFVKAAVEHNAQVIAISAMMMHAAVGENGCKKVRELLREQNLEQRFKIVVGGAPYRFDAELYKMVGADSWAADAVSGSKVIVNLIHEVKSSCLR